MSSVQAQRSHALRAEIRAGDHAGQKADGVSTPERQHEGRDFPRLSTVGCYPPKPLYG
jgi:hypothetical protein